MYVPDPRGEPGRLLVPDEVHWSGKDSGIHRLLVWRHAHVNQRRSGCAQTVKGTCGAWRACCPHRVEQVQQAGRGAFVVFGVYLCVSLAGDRFLLAQLHDKRMGCDFVKTTERREGHITGIYPVRLLTAPRRAIRPSLSM